MNDPTDPPLNNGDPGGNWHGKIGRTFAESTPYWPAPQRPAAGAPNVVIVLLDDLGFAELGCFGSEIQTPHLDRLAAQGLRLNNYTTVPMCAPARAALLTGKNPHSVGVGWLTHANPGYPGFQAGEMSKDAPTVAELLRDAGYSTYAVGKWHNAADYNVHAASDKSSWPLQRGFDRFYGFLGAETNYHAPGQLVQGNELLSTSAYHAGYFSTDDFTDRAIAMLKAHQTAAPDKPFLLYLAPNAPHTPHHAKPSDIAKYKGRYHAGWDVLRRQRHARQRELGVIGDWTLPQHSPGVALWDEMPAQQRDILAAYMEIYAALVDNIDQNIGRLVNALGEIGALDNTLILVTSDNGASSIGGDDGAANFTEKRVTQQESPQLARRMLQQGVLGAVNTSPAYPKGWANAGNTPFRFFKRTPMNGGIRVPLIAHWPARLQDCGAIRQQWVHVTDLMPTLLELMGLDYPRQFKGYRTRTLDGVSFLDVLLDAKADSKRSEQYYELEGNRGYICGRWKIASLQPPGQKIDLDNWMLFDLAADPTETTNLAVQHPEVVRALIERFDQAAFENYAYPLDNRTLVRALTHDPHRIKDVNRPYVFYPGSESTPALVASALVADRDYELRCSFDYQDGMQGVLFALGDSLRGFCAFVIDAQVVVHYNGGFLVKRDLRLPLSPGQQLLTLSHKARGRLQGHAEVKLDGGASGTLDMSPCILMLNGEGLDIGLDRKTPVSAEYQAHGCFEYPGRIDWVKIDPGAQAPGSWVNRAEELAQKDW